MQWKIQLPATEPVNLLGSRSNAVVSGGAILNIGGTATSISQFTTPTLPPFPPLNFTFTPNLNEVIVLPLTTVNLAPGLHDNVVVSPTGTLVLSPGTYLFNTLNIDPAATLQVNDTLGAIDVDVQTQILHLGAVSISGQPGQFVLGYKGLFPVLLLTNFSGVVITPNAALALSQPLFGSYVGAFFAQDIAVAAGVKVTQTPFACQ